MAIAETNLVTDTEEKLTANNACLGIAKEGERNTQLRLQAGVGTHIDVLIARYLRRHCEIQRIELKLGKSDLESNTSRENIRESQSQPQKLIDLARLERWISEDRQQGFFSFIPDSLLDHYITNTKLLQKLNSQGQPLEIHTDDSDVQKLYKQQFNDALELYRLIALRMKAGVIDDYDQIGEIMLPAVLIAIADTNLATKPNEREIASRTCLEIARAWEKDIFARRETTSKTRIRVLTVNYWKRQCDIQKLQMDKI